MAAATVSAKGKQGAAVGVDPVGGAQHGGLGLDAYALHVGRGELVRGQAELGQPDEIRAQRLDTALHEDIVHVGMGPELSLSTSPGFGVVSSSCWSASTANLAMM